MVIDEYIVTIVKFGLLLGTIGSAFAFYTSYLISSVLDGFNKVTR